MNDQSDNSVEIMAQTERLQARNLQLARIGYPLCDIAKVLKDSLDLNAEYARHTISLHGVIASQVDQSHVNLGQVPMSAP
jgi:hypothetical protein